MDRFGTESISEIEKIVSKSVPKNTENNHQYVWRQFKSFCDAKKYNIRERLTVQELADILTNWGYNMKKQNGEEYKECTVKTMWNVAAKILMDKYYKEFNVKFNAFTDVQFKKARGAKNAKRKELQYKPEKRKESSVFLIHNQFQNLINSCDEETADGLQKKLFFILAYELAWRGGEGSKCLNTYFKKEINNEGENTGRIQYNPVFSKITQGGDKPCASSKWLMANKASPNYCPIRLFNKFMMKREGVRCERLFLTVNPEWKTGKCYKKIPVGRNTMSKWTSSQAQKSGLATEKIKITNHSLRATAVSKLAKKGVEEQQLIKITGHSNTKSITPYLQMDEEHHQNIVEKMRDNDTLENPDKLQPQPYISGKMSLSATSNTNYYNCVFHCSQCNF